MAHVLPGVLFSFCVGLVVNLFIVTNLPLPSNFPALDAQHFDFKKEEALLVSLVPRTDEKELMMFMKRRYLTQSMGIQNTAHLLAHTVGSALYTYRGMRGLLACDDAFQYGCYHGFTYAAVKVNNDTSSLVALEKACMTAGLLGLQCFHGVGHGLLELDGYTRNTLEKTLSRCDVLTSVKYREACYNGTFMQYNRRVGQFYSSNKSLGLRPYDTTHSYEPCDTVPQVYQSQCYAEIPFWWSEVFTIKKFGSKWDTILGLCSGISDSLNRSMCFQSAGTLIGVSLDRSREKSPSSLLQCRGAYQDEDTKVCMLGMVRILKYFNSDILRLVCSVISEDESKEYCGQ